MPQKKKNMTLHFNSGFSLFIFYIVYLMKKYIHYKGIKCIKLPVSYKKYKIIKPIYCFFQSIIQTGEIEYNPMS